MVTLGTLKRGIWTYAKRGFVFWLGRIVISIIVSMATVGGAVYSIENLPEKITQLGNAGLVAGGVILFIILAIFMTIFDGWLATKVVEKIN